jgi:hypothetical protein
METIDPRDLELLRELIRCLNSRPRLSVEERELKFKRYFRNVFTRMTEHAPTYGAGGPGMAPYSADLKQFNASLRSIDNNLREQLRIVTEGVEHYFCNGEYPPPYYAWRISVILRKLKLLALELAFLEAFYAKFFDGAGKRYGEIGERIEKLRNLI